MTWINTPYRPSNRMKIAATSGQYIGVGGKTLKLAMPRITVSGNEFRRSGVRWKGWGFQQNLHDFIEAFFAESGTTYDATMEDTFRGDRDQGGNLVRLRLELWTMISGSSIGTLAVNTTAMANLVKAINFARKCGIYVQVCGCNTVRATTTPPAWYDALSYNDRWTVQTYFWTEVVRAVKASGNSTTVLGYDLINEPFISTNPTEPWYGTGYLGSTDYFTACIARGVGVNDATAAAWITQLRDAIKVQDPNALVTVGVLPFDTGPFGVSNTEGLLDYLSPHLYPPNTGFGESHSLAYQLDRIAGFGTSTKPIVVGETIPWASESDNDTFFAALNGTYDGLVSFSYGYGVDEFTVPPATEKPPLPPGTNATLSIAFQTAFDSYRAAFMA